VARRVCGLRYTVALTLPEESPESMRDAETQAKAGVKAIAAEHPAAASGAQALLSLWTVTPRASNGYGHTGVAMTLSLLRPPAFLQ
jgi:hypothetical protein